MATLQKPENPLLVQARVVVALMLRDMRVTFGTSQLGYFWAVFSPAFGTSMLVVIFSFISRHPPIGTSFGLFFALGIIPFEMYRKINSSLMSVLDQNKGLLAYPLVKEFDVIFARFFLVFLTYLLIMIIFYSGLIVFLGVAPPSRIEQVIAAVGSAALFGLGIGVTNAVLLRLWSSWRQVEGILSRPMFFTSGILFIPTIFPPYIRDLLSWNPLIHVIEWIREGYYPNYHSVLLDKQYLYGWIGGLLVFGMVGERLYRKKVK
ncbi:MAG: ABC transporter permease [Lentilitoribacter sp.]